jgi:hypothetical protein
MFYLIAVVIFGFAPPLGLSIMTFIDWRTGNTIHLKTVLGAVFYFLWPIVAMVADLSIASLKDQRPDISAAFQITALLYLIMFSLLVLRNVEVAE